MKTYNNTLLTAFSTITTIAILSFHGSVVYAITLAPEDITVIDPFDFTELGDVVRSLSEFNDKPIVLEWGASWCPVCEQNQENAQSVYELYGDRVNFVSLSYGGSGDTLDEVLGMKNRGPYNWTFGLDHTNQASIFDTRNGYVWLLTQDLSLVQKWNSTVVPVSQLREGIESVLPEESLETSSIDENVEVLPLDNPVFLLFALLGIGAVVVILVGQFMGKKS